MVRLSRKLSTSYAAGFRQYLATGGEVGLRIAYDLGRRAILQRLNVMDLARIHHDVVLATLEEPPYRHNMEKVIEAAADFFSESLSTFEMVRRGFLEAEERALLEKHQTAIMQQLSKLFYVGDAVDPIASLREVLQIVAEQASEMTGAEFCFASAVVETEIKNRITARFVATRGKKRACLVEAEVRAIEPTIRLSRAPVRVDQRDWARHPIGRLLSQRAREQNLITGWVAVPLTGEGGMTAGFLHVLNKKHGQFSIFDEANLVRLAELGSSAIRQAMSCAQQRKADLAVYRGLLPARLRHAAGTDASVRLLHGPNSRFPHAWYDMFTLDTRQTAIAVGDIAASGVDTALAIAQLRASLRACTDNADSPQAVVEQLDKIIQALDEEHSSTMSFAIIDSEKCTASIVRAGHSSPLLISPDGESVMVDGEYGDALGASPAACHRALKVPLQPGSAIVMYSNGVIDDPKTIDRRLGDCERQGNKGSEISCEELLQDLAPSADQNGVLLVIKLVVGK